MEEKKNKELKKVQPQKITIKIKGKEREIKFNFNAWAKIEEEYDGMENFERVEKDMVNKPFQTIPKLLWIALRDKEGLDQETFLDEFGLADVENITRKLTEALYGSLPEDDGKKEKVEA